jgi:hypothetical protein
VGETSSSGRSFTVHPYAEVYAMPSVFFGTLREHYLLLFGVAGSVALVAGFIGAWIGARFGARTAVHRTAIEATDAVASRADIHAMNAELQALLVEVERIAEGQRFVAKLLAERGDRAALPSPSPRARHDVGEVTPH